MTTFADILLDDLEALFGEYGFAEDASYLPAIGEARTVRVIFDEAYQEVDLKTKAPIGSISPAAHMQASSLPDEIDDDDRLIIQGKTYRINVPKPDGHGAVVCRLHRVGA